MADMTDDLKLLQGRLADCAELYQIRDLAAQRSAVVHALCAVNDYLALQGFAAEMLLPIMRPALALAEREHNVLDQMFSERARKGRPNVTLEEQERTGILASFANAWLRIKKHDDQSQESKLAEAARQLRGGWFGHVSKSNLKTARGVVSQELSDHPAVVLCREFDKLFSQAELDRGPLEAFSFIIRFVNNAPAGHVAGIWKTPPVLSKRPD
jgi:hypothetical protein